VKTILLTGSTGFVGSAILKVLIKKYKIICLNRKKVKQIKNVKNIYFKDYDDLNKKLKSIKVDVVIHCATHYIKTHSHKDIEKLADSNLIFGNIILENLKQMKVKLFINFTTVWENFNGVKDNFYNLYSVYKKNFTNILNFYKKLTPEINFYNLYISDTFGDNDIRPKIVNILRKNYKNNKITNIISSNLYINLLNIIDIIEAISIILINKSKPGEYNLVNSKNFYFTNIIKKINEQNKKKIKVKWLSKKRVKDKIYNKTRLKGWTPKKSEINDIINLIKH
jgi:nucleoside-diphosphate-sugar epimerase